MAQTACMIVRGSDRLRLEAIATDRNRPRKHVERAHVVLASAVGGSAQLDATGRCPLEDVGGPCGYSDLINTLADPSHERHDELTEWIGGPFDPLKCNVDDLAKAVDALARKWSQKPTPTSRKIH